MEHVDVIILSYMYTEYIYFPIIFHHLRLGIDIHTKKTMALWFRKAMEFDEGHWWKITETPLNSYYPDADVKIQHNIYQVQKKYINILSKCESTLWNELKLGKEMAP